MLKYHLTAQGQEHLKTPYRNRKGVIPAKYFRIVILVYMLSIKELYLPNEFKCFIQSLRILNQKDMVLMNTRNYPVWKHHIDRAKQMLLDSRYIYEHDNTFYINSDFVNQIYCLVSDYISPMNSGDAIPNS